MLLKTKTTDRWFFVFAAVATEFPQKKGKTKTLRKFFGNLALETGKKYAILILYKNTMHRHGAKENTMKRIALALALLLLVCFVASCGKNAISDKVEIVNNDPKNNEIIPATLDVSGDFNVLVAGYKGNDFEGVADGGTSVEQAVYQRNEWLRAYYGINVTNAEFLGYGTTNGNGNGFQKIYTDYMAGISTYDAAMIGTGDVANLAQNGMLWDLSSLPHLDLTKEYWDQKANEDLAIAGKMFYTTGDISVVDNIYTHALLFNKDLISSYDLENPYDLVKDNEWTLEKLGTLVKQVGQDVDNNGVYDEKDLYGLMIWNDPIAAMLAGAGEKIATVNEDGELELTFYNERVVNLYDTLDTILFNPQNVYNYQYDNATGKGSNISTWDTNRFAVFNENRVVFNFGALSLVESHRDSEVDFGILPYPKFDASQKDYGHLVSGFHTQFFCIPMTADPVRSSAVAELLAYYGKEYLTPAYYEKTLYGKYIRDEESSEMLDIIFASHVFDVGVYYEIGGYFSQIQSRFETRKALSSIYETYKSAAEVKIQQINESFAKNSNVVYSEDAVTDETTAPVVIDTAPYTDATVVYLASNGQGNGSNAVSAVNTMTAALDALDLSKDCTVVVCGNYVQNETFVYTDTFTGSVTVTSNYDGVDYREQGAVYTAPAVRFVCSGEYVFRDIDFSLIGNFFYFIANHYPFTLDTGIGISAMSDKFTGSGFANAFSIAGGYQSGQPIVVGGEVPAASDEADINVTVNSGYNICIGAYSRGVKEANYTGTATVNIGGDAIVSKLYLVPVNGAFTSGNTVVNLTDSASITSMQDAVDGGTCNGITVNWLGGTVGAFARRADEAKPLLVTEGAKLVYAEAVKSDANFEAISALFDSAEQK